MRVYRSVVRTLIVGAMLASAPWDAHAEESICAAGEVQHKVASGDTIGRIAERYYCVDGDRSAGPIAQWLADHNGTAIGEDRTRLYPGTLLCLPEHFRGATWVATRCWPERSKGEIDKPPVPSSTEDKPTGDKPPPTSAEVRRTETPEPPKEAPVITAKLPASNAGGPDTLASSPKKKTKILRRVSAEVLGGVLVPFSAETRSNFYQALGLAGVGARVTLGIVDIAPRLLFVGSNSNTTYNGQQNQEQSMLGGGGTAQIGLALGRGAWRFTPGIEGGWIGIQRSVTRKEYPYEGSVATSRLGLSMAGVFFRPEYQFGSASRLNVAVEVGGDVVAFYRTNGDLDAGLNGRISGGVGYAF